MAMLTHQPHHWTRDLVAAAHSHFHPFRCAPRGHSQQMDAKPVLNLLGLAAGRDEAWRLS